EEKIQKIVMEKLKLVDMVIAKDNFPNDISGGMKKEQESQEQLLPIRKSYFMMNLLPVWTL
ncbi:hypothetical protein LEP1GSC151_3379, partial [Leptospira interrogans serovar Grippotyphosa str. LT2186]